MEVEIWSDIACPWCFIGKRRFEAALARFAHRDEVNVIWRSFELDPEAPAERAGDLASRLAEKYGITVEQAHANQEHLSDLAAAEHLEFRFDLVRSGSTFDAHRVVHLAERHGLQDAMKERMLRAYFSEGQLLGDRATLGRLAAEVGLDGEQVTGMLASGLYAEEVRTDERTAQALGISAVPTFVVDRALGVSGAQSPDALLELLDSGWGRRTGPAVTASA